MTYSDTVKWPEVEALIRARMRAQPRGYQQDLAILLGVSVGFVSNIVTGRKPIPVERLDTILTSLNLEYDVVIKELHSSSHDHERE